MNSIFYVKKLSKDKIKTILNNYLKVMSSASQDRKKELLEEYEALFELVNEDASDLKGI